MAHAFKEPLPDKSQVFRAALKSFASSCVQMWWYSVMLSIAPHLSVFHKTSQKEVRDALAAHPMGTVLGNVLHTLPKEAVTPLTFGVHQKT